MAFEFDPRKSVANKAKHGIDFTEAQALWAGEVLEVAANSTLEPRLLVIGKIGVKHWSAIITARGNNVRIISVRRSREIEIQAYENR